jgi:hypothetical protein
MPNFCKSCGKQLPFFQGLLNSFCDDCEKKNVIAINPPSVIPSQNQNSKTITNNRTVDGKIAFYNLQEWWQNSFLDEERNTILSLYSPMGLKPDSLIHGKIQSSNQTVVAFLSQLSSWFKKPENRKIGYKIIEKAESLVSEKTPILDKHFLYQAKLDIYYRNRETDDFALSIAMEACNQQIEISLDAKKAFLKEYSGIPSHKGFEQLCIILEKQKKVDEVIRLAKLAKEQGWSGDWDKRIERNMKKNN